ncbi:MAG: Hsp20/alpha crystallin family protein [Deltaproteobacteria bacterium]
MSSAPKKGKERMIKTEGEATELFEPFFSIFGFESIQEKGFPVIDVFENLENVFIEAELPGVGKEFVTISIVEGELVIEGEKAEDRYEGEKVNYLCIERNFGRFRRTVDIPAAADTSKVKARYSEGILLVTIPKVKEQRRKSRIVEIE